MLHALRVLHDWLQTTHIAQSTLGRVPIDAGDYRPIGALQRWRDSGTLDLKSAAASPLVEDIRRITIWQQVDLSLLPFNLPMDIPGASGLPLIYQAVATIFEEFRIYAPPGLGKNWVETLPRFPLSKEEVMKVLKEELGRDEMLLPRLLSPVESVSAEIIVRLELTRERIRVAYTMLREEDVRRRPWRRF